MRRGGIIFSLSLLEITETSSSGKILGGDRPLLGIGGGGGCLLLAQTDLLFLAICKEW